MRPKREAAHRTQTGDRSTNQDSPHSVSPAEKCKCPPPAEWLCEGLLPSGGLVLLTGKTKSGKSALALDVAIGAATGTGAVRTSEGGWLFDFKGKRCRTFHLDTVHSKDLLLRRLDSLCAEKGEESSALLGSGDLICDPLELNRPAPFLSGAEGKAGIQADIQAARDFGARMRAAGVSLVILDEISHCYQEDSQGRDELSAGFVKDFLRIISAIAAESGACVLLVHHQRKGAGQGSEQVSGSGQLLVIPDHLLTLSKLDEELGIFALEKQGRRISTSGKVHLQACSSKDGKCRIFVQVSGPIKDSRPSKRTRKADRGTYEGA